MKKIKSIYLLGVMVFLFSCGGEESNLEALKEKKASITSELKSLQKELESIEGEIALLDSSVKEKDLELVNVSKVEKKQFKHYIEAQGTTFSENNISVTTDMGGLVKSIYVEEGQYVNKGAPLIQLDNAVILDQIAELETNLALAKEVFEKRKRLWDQNIGSEIEYLQAKNNYEALENKKATVYTQLAKMTIKAPINGYIDVIDLKLGEMASPGYPAVKIVNNSNMEVKVDLPETYLGKVKVGDDVLVSIPTLNEDRVAKVKSVGQTVSKLNRTFQVTAKIANNDNAVKPNMLVQAKFTSKVFEDVIVIPAKYLQESANGYFVFTASKDTTSSTILAHKKVVEIGDSYDGEIVIESGLNEGDLLIEEGYRSVLDEQEIEVNNKELIASNESK